MNTLVLGLYETNCYILQQDGTAVIIDPGYDDPRILAALAPQSKLAAVLLTHGHFDHVGGVAALRKATGCPVYIHQADLALPEDLSPPFPYTHTYDEGDRLSFGPFAFRVLHTPGHSPGSVCLCQDKRLFCGDTLFTGSCGRTDLAGGSYAELRRSLARLYDLEGEYQVLPGHGPASTLENQRQTNPYLQMAAGQGRRR